MSCLLACIGVDSPHLLGTDRVVPHDLVQGRRLGVTHVDRGFAAYIEVYGLKATHDEVDVSCKVSTILAAR